jgi:hypothetical protein
MHFATWSDGRPFGIALRKFGASDGRVIQRDGALGWATENSRHRMSTFPGAIYDGQGKSLDPTIPDLLQEQFDSYPHRSMVTDRDMAPVARVWLLAADATPDAIPPILMIEAVKLVMAGKGVLILAQRPEPEVDVREGLLQALDLFTATQDVAGHA